MKLEDQVVNLELAKRLKKLGVEQESYLFWNEGHWDDTRLVTPSFMGNTGILPSGQNYSAFTVAELGEMLPRTIDGDAWLTTGTDQRRGWCIGYFCDDTEAFKPLNADTEADARALMLCYLIENGLLDAKKIN